MAFICLVTDLGQAKIAAAIGTGGTVNIVECAVGDGGGAPTTPSSSDTSLVNEVGGTRFAVNEITRNLNQVSVNFQVPYTVGGFTIREVACFDDDGDMILIANVPEDEKPGAGETGQKTANYTLTATVQDGDVVQVTVDPLAVNASKAYVGQNFVRRVPDLPALRALTGMQEGQATQIVTTGRAGLFRWDSSDLKAECDADPQMGIYVPPTGQDGSAGAWVRVFEGAVSVLWFGAAGDGVTDDTGKVQAAVNSGAAFLDFHDYNYCMDGQVDLPIEGIKITGNGWSISRGVANNSDKMFSAVGATGLIEFENGSLIGNVVQGGPGYDPLAAGIWCENCADVIVRDMKVTGFSVGLRTQYVGRVTVIGGEYTGNILGGISGMANNVRIDGADVYANGFAGSAGQSHDIYIINGTGGVITNCYIGDPVDTASDSLALRYDETNAITGFDDLSDWQVFGNRLTGGVRVSSDPGVGVANRKPPNSVDVFSNVFSGGAGLRFDDPQACRSWGNRGIYKLTVGVASLWPSYYIGFISENDECSRVNTNALGAKRIEASSAVIFKNTIINNGPSPAFNEIFGFGGYTSCTIIEPRIMGSGEPFDSASLARYGNNMEIPVISSGSMRHMARHVAPHMARTGLAETAIADGATWNPGNHTATDQAYLIGRFNGATGTVGAPTVAATGMVLRLMLRIAAPSAVVSFSADYKLSAVTSGYLALEGANGERMVLEFIYETGAWRQIGDASWIQA